jgi:hypothetical protein
VIELAVDCVRFGRLAVASAVACTANHYCVPAAAFEIIRLAADGTALAVARIEVERADPPALKVSALPAEERVLDAAATATIGGKAVLMRWRDDAPTHFKLAASGADDRIEIVLSGDCRHRLFWWRAEFKLIDDKVIVHGPFLSHDD